MQPVVTKFGFIVVAFVLAIQVNLLCVHGQNTGSPVYTELETLTPTHKESLKKFKQLASPILTHDYMNDLYLLKFLKANRFSVEKSFEQLKEALQWRKDNKIDEYWDNPPDFFEEFARDFPIYTDGVDKVGRPICELPFGWWPIRKAAVAGKLKQLYIYYFVTCSEYALRKIHLQQAKGLNVTEFVFIANMQGFTIAEQGCPACIPLHLSIVSGNERWIPYYGNGIYLINTPDSFASIFRLVRPIMSAQTRSVLKIFTSNEAQWKPFLQKRIDFSELSDYLGGGRVRQHS